MDEFTSGRRYGCKFDIKNNRHKNIGWQARVRIWKFLLVIIYRNVQLRSCLMNVSDTVINITKFCQVMSRLMRYEWAFLPLTTMLKYPCRVYCINKICTYAKLHFLVHHPYHFSHYLTPPSTPPSTPPHYTHHCLHHLTTHTTVYTTGYTTSPHSPPNNSHYFATPFKYVENLNATSIRKLASIEFRYGGLSRRHFTSCRMVLQLSSWASIHLVNNSDPVNLNGHIMEGRTLEGCQMFATRVRLQ